uniref:Uncharacterized protein n=1 Tax=Globodera rostochiensis TaxID=31243 RepID=A0A914HPK2_GLORO
MKKRSSEQGLMQEIFRANFNPFVDWFIENYVEQLCNNGTRRQPLFAPEEWSVHLRTLEGADRTINFCETFHRRSFDGNGDHQYALQNQTPKDHWNF